MKTFYRDEMVVIPQELTIPSHEKTLRLLNTLRQDRRLELVADFSPLPLGQWSGIHAPSYVRSVTDADVDTFEAASNPVSDCMVTAIEHCTASMVAATFAALEFGCAFSPTSGFHHAHWAQPGVFCLLNALPLAAQLALSKPSVNRVLILDCDYHRGNGTNDILARLDDTRIVHNSLGYKFSRPAHARAYLQEIERVCESIEKRNVDLVIYQAGMDVLIGDPAGGGVLSLDETRTRDALVFSACRGGQVPIVWNLAGGYTLPGKNGIDIVVSGHLNTYDCAVEQFG
jgi:acetoin utilization deacetylase AcuC-like enzyme